LALYGDVGGLQCGVSKYLGDIAVYSPAGLRQKKLGN
jgi:hypothetical protein